MTRDQGWEGSSHYKALAIEPKDAIQAWLPSGHTKWYFIACVIARLARLSKLGMASDQAQRARTILNELQKAEHEIRLAIEAIEVEKEDGD